MVKPMKTYLTPFHPFVCRESDAVFTSQSAESILTKLGQIKFRFFNFYHTVVGPEWSTHGVEEADYRHKIHFFCSGSAQLIHQGTPVELRPGYAYWQPSSIPVARHCESGFEEFSLTFYCELIDGIDLFGDWAERQLLSVGRWDMDALRDEWTQPPLTLNSLMRIQGMLFQWMAEHFGDLDTIVARHALMFTRYARVFEVADAHLGDDLRVAELARAHGTSLQAFSMAFIRDLGMSPKAYLNRRLNQAACRLLLNTDETVRSIAHQLRFSDEYYFSRFFSKMNGLPPLKYRQTFRT